MANNNSGMTKWREAHLKEALEKIKWLEAATLGDEEQCSCFNMAPFNTHWDEKTRTEIMGNVRIYIQTWVIPSIEKSLQKHQYE